DVEGDLEVVSARLTVHRDQLEAAKSVGYYLLAGLDRGGLASGHARDADAPRRHPLGEVGARDLERASAEHVDPQRRHDDVEHLAGAGLTHTWDFVAQAPASAHV